MHIIKNDPFVSPIAGDQLRLIWSVINEFPVDGTVFLHESIHGYIAEFNYKDGYFIPCQKGTPARLDNESLKFWSDIAPKLRWFEIGHSLIKIAF